MPHPFVARPAGQTTRGPLVSVEEVRIGKTGVLGAFEELVLLALIRQGERAYAVSIRRDLEKRTRTEVAMGSVYATLDRLAEKGLIRPREAPSDESRRGRPRQYFAIRRAGIDALARTHSIRDRMWRGIDLTEADTAAEGA